MLRLLWLAYTLCGVYVSDTWNIAFITGSGRDLSLYHHMLTLVMVLTAGYGARSAERGYRKEFRQKMKSVMTRQV